MKSEEKIWVSSYVHPEKWTFVIEKELMRDIINQEDIEGYYLRVSDSNSNDLYNYLQDELDVAQDQAFEKFGVPLDSWVVRK